MLPALVSASQLRAVTSRDLTEVGIVCFGDLGQQADAMRTVCAELAILLFALPISVLGDIPIASARLILHDVLPAEFDDIIYLDADTQVSGSLDPLLLTSMIDYPLLAVVDPIAFVSAHPTRFGPLSLRHFDNIGLDTSSGARYFNSGVMRFRRCDWKAISAECIVMLKKKPNHFIYPDQDVLNLVVGRNFGRLSLKWNFPGFLVKSKLESEVVPVIRHFMSNPRPWDGPFRPWSVEFHRPYHLFQQRYPALVWPFRPMTGITYLKYLLLTNAKQVYERSVWTGTAFTTAVHENERDAIV